MGFASHGCKKGQCGIINTANVACVNPSQSGLKMWNIDWWWRWLRGVRAKSRDRQRRFTDWFRAPDLHWRKPSTKTPLKQNLWWRIAG